MRFLASVARQDLQPPFLCCGCRYPDIALRSDAKTAGLLHVHALKDKKHKYATTGMVCKGCSCSECMVIALRVLVLTLLARAFIIHCAPPLFAGGRSKPKENPMKRCAIYVFKLQDGSLFERVITARGACSSQYIDTGQRQQQSIRSKSRRFPAARQAPPQRSPRTATATAAQPASLPRGHHHQHSRSFYSIFLAFSPDAFTASALCASCKNCVYSGHGGPDARHRTLECAVVNTHARL